MRRFLLRLTLTVLLLGAIGVGIWAYVNRQSLSWQWNCYRIATAKTFEEAKELIEPFEQGPNRSDILRMLVSRWGTGSRQYDLYLAEYVAHPDSSEALRKEFSLGFAWHEERLPRWAHFWSSRTTHEPDRQVILIFEHLDVLSESDTPPTLTWREVLEIQAVFQLTGQPELARRLSPENGLSRYARWRKNRPAVLPPISRPTEPLPPSSSTAP